MRTDFAKLLCECYKEGRGYATTSGAVRSRIRSDLRDPDAPTGASGYPRRRLVTHRKFFGENLAPLKRFVARQVGRPWDKVYAEIRRHCTPRSAVGFHIYQHMYQYIAVAVREVDGVLCQVDSHWDDPRPLGHGSIYVDPDDGIIKRMRRGRRHCKREWRREREERAAESESERRYLDPDRSLERIADQWYEVRWSPTPTRGDVRDAILARECPVGEATARKAHPGRYPAAKRQLSKRELRDHDLR